ncbi:iron-sulfur cluster assembly protein [Pseudaminobacter sp. 19-2017]|uniref:Iron-sulfur cluster assembly protein n=1 Tax=Pseudaminobacter soli (ex Zhang et al. 2022) TaxID=2831468 RepID=A0A942DW80_9HYPH|nr:iron-sulfur cluster assembly protein [Pseudaminobacter soli]MBS3647677.1 iron-sulfur cluster assembly protein [Pseudaminobacter soli]
MTSVPAVTQTQHASSAEAASRIAQVRAAIATVRDPEIDETVEALQFIVDVDVTGDLVTVSFRLPTFWCPANFVYLMAGEMRRAVVALPWVKEFRLRLVDHFAADEINRAIGEGLSFSEAFPGQATRNLDELRRTFDRKAFLMRQSALVSLLRRRGWSDEIIAYATAAQVAGRVTGDDELAAAWSAYRQKWEMLDFPPQPDARIVVNLEGRPITAGDLVSHLRQTRRLTNSASANGEMCRILMEARRSGSGCGAAHVGNSVGGPSSKTGST